MKSTIKASLGFQHICWLLIVSGVLGACTAGIIMLVDAAHSYLTKPELLIILSLYGVVNVSVLLLYALRFVHPVLQRTAQASEAARELAAGNHSTQLDIKGRDELSALAQSLTQLSVSASQKQDQMVRDNQSLNHQATHDDLTGLSNRKYGNETIAKLDTNNDDKPTSILFLDLDGFKAVNDTCGHAVGDEILVSVSLRLKATLSKTAELIRWGGDEFVIVLPGADQRKAISTAQDVAALFRQPIATSDGVHKLGCSIGLATSRADTSLDDVLQEADASMYEQKKKRHASKVESDNEAQNDVIQWPEDDFHKAA